MALNADEFIEFHSVNNLAIHDNDNIEKCSNKKIQLTSNNIIFCRGRKSDNNKGKVQFCTLINTQLGAYIGACDGVTKRKVTEDIPNQVLKQEGQFLKWDNSAWSIADNQSTIQKVLKTLCNKMHSNRRRRQDHHYNNSDVLSEEVTLQSNHASNILDRSTLSILELKVSS